MGVGVLVNLFLRGGNWEFFRIFLAPFVVHFIKIEVSFFCNFKSSCLFANFQISLIPSSNTFSRVFNLDPIYQPTLYLTRLSVNFFFPRVNIPPWIMGFLFFFFFIKKIIANFLSTRSIIFKKDSYEIESLVGYVNP